MKTELSPGAVVVLRIRSPKVELTPSGAPPVRQNRLMIRNNYIRSESEDFVSAPVQRNVSDSGSRSQ
jgi:hypothetical protein